MICTQSYQYFATRPQLRRPGVVPMFVGAAFEV